MNEQYREAMGKALFLANRARETGDVPVGAVVVDEDGRIIGRGWNCREANHDPAGHAEIVALREAGRARGTWRLTGCTLIVTLEPCTMCAGAILASRIDRVVFGAWDPKAGAAGSLRDVLRDARMPHPTEVVGGVLAQEAAMQLRSFFLGCRTPDEMPVVQAPVHEPGDIVAPIVVPYEEDEAPEPINEEAPHEELPHDEGVPAQLVTPAAPAAPVAPAERAHAPAHAARVPSRHRGTEASPLPRRVGRPFSERVSGNADNPADIPVGESIEPGAPVSAPPSQPPYPSAAPVMPAVSPDMTRGPITKSVPQIRPVHVRPTSSVPEGLYTPAQPGRPVTQPLRESAPRPPAPEPVVEPALVEPQAPVQPVRAMDEPIPAPPTPPAFPQRASSRQSARPQRPLPQAFEPEPARRVDYELSPRQFNDVDPITSGIRVRRSARRRGNARH
ncbi:cytidine and deoxycytidylate deaminase zinc-binding region [Actinomyces sp. ICM39]|uniref:tRNA adenosine(34) deaminase TadA n=1 Tax=Actinomyces sp. ICM39 TaxID=1105029 RepID=UPI0002770B98|nr:tRNA adenosine(34) deaminase TadA [Actinomyces sp. ICM39]EJN45994.1 cytidine and deoxycytidylate deaminase zinc-binding region [Actinomyces sp. ICM39]